MWQFCGYAPILIKPMILKNALLTGVFLPAIVPEIYEKDFL